MPCRADISSPREPTPLHASSATEALSCLCTLGRVRPSRGARHHSRPGQGTRSPRSERRIFWTQGSSPHGNRSLSTRHLRGPLTGSLSDHEEVPGLSGLRSGRQIGARQALAHGPQPICKVRVDCSGLHAIGLLVIVGNRDGDVAVLTGREPAWTARPKTQAKLRLGSRRSSHQLSSPPLYECISNVVGNVRNEHANAGCS